MFGFGREHREEEHREEHVEHHEMKNMWDRMTSWFSTGAGGHVHAKGADEAKKHFEHHHIAPIRTALKDLNKTEKLTEFNKHVESGKILENVGKTWERFHSTAEGKDGAEHQTDYLHVLESEANALKAWVTAHLPQEHEKVLKKAHEIFEEKHKHHTEQAGGKRRRRKSRRGRKTHHKGGKKHHKKSKKHHKKSKKHHKKSKKH
jgi:hypothetical protein